MPQFSDASKNELDTCHAALRKTANRAICYYDFSVLEGHRGEERQNRLYRQNRTEVRWPNSRHNKNLSHAVDVAPYPIDWDDEGRFYVLAGVMQMSFAQLQEEGKIDDSLRLRWGGDWDGDGFLDDNGFDDLPHYELVFAGQSSDGR